MMMADRRHLPSTREAVTHKFSINGHEGYLTIGIHEDGSPGEIFIKMSKAGSTLSGLINAFCRAFSLALQYGLPLDDAIARFREMRFEPMGPTSNPRIPQARSIVDYTVQYLALHFGPEAVNGTPDEITSAEARLRTLVPGGHPARAGRGSIGGFDPPATLDESIPDDGGDDL